MVKLLVIDNYDSFTYNLVHYLADLGADCEVHRNDAISIDEAQNNKAQGIVLSPGPCTPNEAGICVKLVKAIDGTKPILGVCLGHQSIAQAYGGKIVRAQSIMHGKIDTISHFKSRLFEGLPERFDVTRYHSLSADRESFPASLKVTAVAGDGEIMGLEHETAPVFGVQFHPESIASHHGHEILSHFLSICETYK